ncbi:MAG: hypothetical protein ACREBI_05075 [Nitrosotalea sp.]
MQKSKNSSKYSPDLSQEEIEAIERLESGKGKYKDFENVEDVIKWLHGKNQKSKK